MRRFQSKPLAITAGHAIDGVDDHQVVRRSPDGRYCSPSRGPDFSRGSDPTVGALAPLCPPLPVPPILSKALLLSYEPAGVYRYKQITCQGSVFFSQVTYQSWRFAKQVI
jgi:hypothetical protein